MEIIVSDEIESVCPTFVGAAVEANVVNTPYSEGLWSEIKEMGETYKSTLTTETSNFKPGSVAFHCKRASKGTFFCPIAGDKSVITTSPPELEGITCLGIFLATLGLMTGAVTLFLL